MSLLLNPSFENGTTNWKKVSHADEVTYEVHKTGEKGVVARSGDYYLVAKTNVSGGSFAQDITVTDMRSVTGIAWIRALKGNVTGSFHIWNLNVGVVTNRFAVGTEWSILTPTLELTGSSSPKNLRFEFYIDTPGTYLVVDGVNGF
ncbi:hypothetical protein [Streptomyces sp. NPDC046939]|uniref:hypothetical protein n=1 Tax=Streptomyces sp. NPDC046939 TaxID=3155376 RepID=UPI0033F4B9A3